MDKTKTTAKDFFVYLGIIIGLYVSSVSFLVLVFQIINKTFPLSGEYLYGYEQAIRSSLSALIIFFPAFIYLLWLANKDLKINPDKKDVWVRRWMIFLTLFIAGLTIAIDLTTLIYRFLGAEDLTLRFFLKVFFVLAVAITIFRSTLYDLRRNTFEADKKVNVGTYIVSTIVILVVVFGIITIGSPAKQKAKQLDETRVSNLMSIQSEIVYTHWQNKGDIPANLNELNNPINSFVVPKDPITGENYEYKKISKNIFEICANFETKNIVENETKRVTKIYYIDNKNWQHNSGRYCFTRNIDEEIYKVESKTSY
jgi:hypothetical protein